MSFFEVTVWRNLNDESNFPRQNHEASGWNTKFLKFRWPFKQFLLASACSETPGSSKKLQTTFPNRRAKLARNLNAQNFVQNEMS